MSFQPRTPLTLKIATLSLALLFGVGCEVEAEGEEGNFTFRYVDGLGTVASDLAVGARVDIQVVDADTDSAVIVDEAFSEAADVIDVVDFVTGHGESRFTLEALSAGSARIVAESGTGDEMLRDSAIFEAATATQVELDSICSSGTFLTNGHAIARYRMRDDASTLLTGYGLYLADVDPPEGGEVDEDYRRLGFLRLNTGDEAGTYSLASQVDDGSLDFELVDAASIDELNTNFDEDTIIDTLEAGESRHMAPFTLKIGEDQICGPPGANIVVTVDDESVCTARYGREFDNIPTLLDLHTLYVAGLDAGTCTVTIAVADTALEASFQVEVN